MDIKSLSEFITGKSPVSRTADLLSQLKAAGTIEAEVIKVLQGKLLLSSRLGEILTTNTLNFKPGDQINLRLSGDEQNPVLKASPKVPRPVILDSAQNPRLSRVLPAGRPVLAVVSKIAAQRIEIRLAGQILTLPRPAGVARNQLLSLQRNDASRSIEIKPLERKLIYKGLLKQLIPDQPRSTSTSMVRLLELVRTATGATSSTIAPTPASSALTAKSAAANKLVPSRPESVPRQADTRADSSAPLTTKPDLRLPTSASRDAALPSLQKMDYDRQTPTETNRQLGALLRQINRTQPRPAASENAAKSATFRSGSASGNAQNRLPTRSIALPQSSLPEIEKSGHPTTPGKQNNVSTGEQAGTRPEHLSRTDLSRQQMPPVLINAPVEANPTRTSPQTSTTPTLLQILLQMVPKLADVDAPQIKQWFEFLRLIHPSKTGSSAAMPADSLKALKQLVDKESFSRELDLTLQQRTKSAAPDETPAVKTPPREILLALVRDGIKLAEQALSHNLLQRASLGLQQETQQTQSLSIALPFIDQEEVKPLHINLEQREQLQEDEDKSWDIRLNFELAELGPVACHIFLQGVTVAASFYCERPHTRTRVEQALPELRQQFAGAGFTAGEFHSFPGKPEQTRTSTASGYPESLIDIEA